MRTKNIQIAFLSFVLLNIFILPVNMPVSALAVADAAVSTANVWWPSDGAHVVGVQPFKAMVDGLDVSQYDMFWQVDGGQLNHMDSTYADYQHKEASVDTSSWSWHGSGPYQITFSAQKDGVTVAERTIQLYINNGLPTFDQTPAPVAVQTEAVVQAQQAVQQIETTQSAWVDPDPVHQAQTALQRATAPVVAAVASAPVVVSLSTNSNALYVDPNSQAAAQATAWRNSNPASAAKMDMLASQPTAKWFGGWSGDIQSAVSSYVDAAANAGKVPVMVAYNLPQRDCGGYSAGGTADYTNWIGGLSRGIGTRQAIVILEPDALAQMSCLSAADQQNRYNLLSSAVSILKSNSNTKVYLDAGHSNWIDAATMATQLNKANINQADGFALNVSNFFATGDEVNYGSQISSQLGGKHFVVDTARNGSGSKGEWCNPSGMSIGQKPTTNTGNSIVDAFLWLKTPGESDGTCNGGPSAGTWWPDYALSLVK